MKQVLQVENHTDTQGNPAGGHVFGDGLQIVWQNGPLQRGNERRAPNGAFVEGVIQAAISRLRFYQESKFASEHNENALAYLEAALAELEARTAEREARGVEGTHNV